MTCISRLNEGGAMGKENPTLVEERGVYRDYEYLVVLTRRGHRCGYVAIGEDHKLYEIKCEFDVELDMHGGCTYFGGQMTDADCSDRWIGFDCAHSGDAKDMDAMRKHFPDEGDCVRSKEYVASECKSIIDQIYSNGYAQC